MRRHFASVDFHLVTHQCAILRDHRREIFVRQRRLRNRAHVLQIARAVFWHRKQLAAQRHARVVDAHEWIELRPAMPTTAAARRASGKAAAATGRARTAKGFVHVVRQHVKHAVGIAVDAVVAGAHPVAIAVGGDHVQCEETQCSVDIQDGFDGGGQFFNGRFLKHFAQRNECLPRFVAVLGLDLETLPVRREFLAEVAQSAIGLRTAGNLPARPAGRAKKFLHKIFVELLHVGKQAPAFAVDHRLGDVRARRGQEIRRELRVKNAAEERRVAHAVEKVKRLVAAQSLVAVHEIHREI